MDSILTSVKESLGIVEECTDFDSVIIMHINTVFSILNQLGAGPTTGFSITDKNAKWTDFISAEQTNMEMIKTYVYAKVKLIFDPPLSSIVEKCTKEIITELESRILYITDT